MPDAAADSVTITVDGTAVQARPGELLIAACERTGTYIPRFCYHPRMESVGMCRMCIVEVDTGRGPALQPSCMLTVAPEMKVDTKSEATVKAQDGVLEFLLINHPLDCPVCDKGGECPLQDQTLSHGPGESRMIEEKRHFEKPIPISATIDLDRERCILCDRCTRFAKDVAGDALIHFLDRGNQTQINTFPDHPFASYFSGNTVQICPVGALTAKPYRFKARPWDLEQTESTCTSCSVGCRVVIDSSRNEVLRYQGVDIDPVNWGWLCDKGRFDFQSVQNPERLAAPLVRSSASLPQAEVRWFEALTAAATAIKDGLDRSGPGGVAVLGGARLSNESAYAWAKLAKGVIGTDHVDAQLGDGLPADAVLGLPRATIDEVCAPGGTVLLIAPDLKEELPVLFLRLRHAIVRDGVNVVELSASGTSYSDLVSASVRYRPGELVHALGALLYDGRTPDHTDAAQFERARHLLGDGPVKVILGRGSMADSPEQLTAAAAYLLDARTGTRFLPVLRRSNVHGALDMGMSPGLLPGRTTLDAGRDWFYTAWDKVPSERGLDAAGILAAAAEGKIDTLILLGADPLADFPDHQLVTRALAGARTVIALDLYLTASAAQADIVLPAAGYAEVGGSTTNIEGRVSLLGQKVTPPGTARADWMIAVELARYLGSDLRIESLDDIWDEIEELAPSHEGLTLDLLRSVGAADGIVAPIGSAPVTATQVGPGGTAVLGAHIPVGGKAPAEIDSAEIAGGAGGVGGEGEPPTGQVEQRQASEAKPAMLSFVAPGSSAGPPPTDAYSLRLVTTRKLYDQGTLVQHSPSIAGLAPKANQARVHPVDFERLGIEPGATVRATSGHGSVAIEAVPDPTVLRGTVVVGFNLAGPAIGELIDATQLVTDVRLESA